MNQPALIAEAKPCIEFSVRGAPLYQGSKISLISGKRVRKGKDVWVKNPIASMVEQADRPTNTRAKGALTAWKKRISAEAASAAGPEHELWTGRIWLECVFVLPRAPSHFNARGQVKASAPVIPPLDFDKMIRAVGDALSKVVYRDDKQITCFDGSTKRFSETAAGKGGVFVKVRAL